MNVKTIQLAEMKSTIKFLAMISKKKSRVYQERMCHAVGGKCQSSTEICAGTSQSAFCPRQRGVDCCIPSYQEEACRAMRGQCKHASECTANDAISSLCPSQSSDVVCCLAYKPYQEPQCAAVDGRCGVMTEERCSDGRWIVSLCPTQAANVACCVSQKPYQE